MFWNLLNYFNVFVVVIDEQQLQQFLCLKINFKGAEKREEFKVRWERRGGWDVFDSFKKNSVNFMDSNYYFWVKTLTFKPTIIYVNLKL